MRLGGYHKSVGCTCTCAAGTNTANKMNDNLSPVSNDWERIQALSRDHWDHGSIAPPPPPTHTHTHTHSTVLTVEVAISSESVLLHIASIPGVNFTQVPGAQPFFTVINGILLM